MIDLQDGEIIKLYKYKEITFYITNYGRLFTIKEKPFKPYPQRVKGHPDWQSSLKIQINIRRKDKWVRYSLGLARLVYKLFVDENINASSRIVFKDGNHLNCRFDNLSVGLEHKEVKPLTQEKIYLFNLPDTERHIRKTLCWYYKTTRIITNNGLFTYDDLVQEGKVLIYKALSNYKITNSDDYGGWIFTIVRKYICNRYRNEIKYVSYDDNRI